MPSRIPAISCGETVYQDRREPVTPRLAWAGSRAGGDAVVASRKIGFLTVRRVQVAGGACSPRWFRSLHSARGPVKAVEMLDHLVWRAGDWVMESLSGDRRRLDAYFECKGIVTSSLTGHCYLTAKGLHLLEHVRGLTPEALLDDRHPWELALAAAGLDPRAMGPREIFAIIRPWQGGLEAILPGKGVSSAFGRAMAISVGFAGRRYRSRPRPSRSWVM